MSKYPSSGSTLTLESLTNENCIPLGQKLACTHVCSSNPLFIICIMFFLSSFPGGSVVKKPPVCAGEMGLIPGLGRSPGEGNGNPF